MEFLQTFLLIVLYILGIALMVVFIVLGIKLIKTVDKTNAILDDVEAKVQSLNGVFQLVDRFSTGATAITSHVVQSVTGLIDRIFRRKKKEEDFEDYE